VAVWHARRGSDRRDSKDLRGDARGTGLAPLVGAMGGRALLGAASVLMVLVAETDATRAAGDGAPRPTTAERHPAYRTATGTLVAYDTATRVLTVHSASGSSDFQVAADARFWLGNRRVPISQLRTHAGSQVTIAWSDQGGVRTTHTVRAKDAAGAPR
jgi:hypothetical protein